MAKITQRKSPAPKTKIRYAVVGLGYIAQIAVLPAFAHAGRNSELVALVSGDKEKLARLGKKYAVAKTYSYQHYGECLNSGAIDAVYIALPNSLHCEYAVRAARAGIHVLCEKPMAVTERECEKMLRAARGNDVKMMVAYRLHFEETNLKAIEAVNSGKIGEPRIFNSVFTMQVVPGDIRLRKETGGGTLYDIGIYCINAARYLFRSEPLEIFASVARNGDRRFAEVEEMASAVMHFPGDRLANFTCSFGAADVSAYQVVGTKGDLRVSPAYEMVDDLRQYLTINGKTTERKFAKRDQFGAELMYFSDCILKNKEPEPSASEGLIDIQIIRALYKSAKTGKSVKLGKLATDARPSMAQEIKLPPVAKPDLINARSPNM
jgi:predicted dehydrogenase